MSDIPKYDSYLLLTSDYNRRAEGMCIHKDKITFCARPNRVFPKCTKLTMLVFLHCLKLKIKWTEKSVTPITIQNTLTNVNLLLN